MKTYSKKEMKRIKVLYDTATEWQKKMHQTAIAQAEEIFGPTEEAKQMVSALVSIEAPDDMLEGAKLGVLHAQIAGVMTVLGLAAGDMIGEMYLGGVRLVEKQSDMDVVRDVTDERLAKLLKVFFEAVDERMEETFDHADLAEKMRYTFGPVSIGFRDNGDDKMLEKAIRDAANAARAN